MKFAKKNYGDEVQPPLQIPPMRFRPGPYSKLLDLPLLMSERHNDVIDGITQKSRLKYEIQ